MDMQLQSEQVIQIIQDAIEQWHKDNVARPEDYVIVTDEIRRIRPLNEHRDNIYDVIKELVDTNSEMWHEEDKVRSADDQVVLKAIRNINPLNQHRNDLMEEIDEIVLDAVKEEA